jgi:hypothetical protein
MPSSRTLMVQAKTPRLTVTALRCQSPGTALRCRAAGTRHSIRRSCARCESICAWHANLRQSRKRMNALRSIPEFGSHKKTADRIARSAVGERRGLRPRGSLFGRLDEAAAGWHGGRSAWLAGAGAEGQCEEAEGDHFKCCHFIWYWMYVCWIALTLSGKERRLIRFACGQSLACARENSW